MPDCGRTEKMDVRSAEILEFSKIRELLAGYAESSLGRELALSVKPYITLDPIQNEQKLVDEMMDAVSANIGPPLSRLRDVRLLVRRAAIGAQLDASQLLEISEGLLVTGAIFRWRSKLNEKHHHLNELAVTIPDLGTVARTIQGCIDPRAHVLDMASPELADVRTRISEVDERLKTMVARLLKDPEIRKVLRYPNASMEGDRFVLPVAANHRHRVAGVVHRTSSSGETLFIEPAGVANLGMERSLLKVEEEREVRKVLRRLVGEVAKVANPFGHAISQMARLDLLQAKARYGLDYQMVLPHFSCDRTLWLKGARHPLLLQLFRNQAAGLKGDGQGKDKNVVPIEVGLGAGHNILVITGPNTGGKTVALKTIGLLALMGQSGMPIPADKGTCLPLFDAVYADIGDEQSLEQSLSTFSSHMTQVARVLRVATSQSMVLLDEMGAGTDPVEGAALGRAILSELSDLGCQAAVTTHLGDIKKYALHKKNMLNAGVEFDPVSLRPTFRLISGKTGKSCALQIAKNLELPDRLLRRARKFLSKKKAGLALIRDLEKQRRESEKVHRSALEATVEGKLKDDAEKRLREEQERQNQKKQAIQKWRESIHPGLEVLLPTFGQKGTVNRVNRDKGIVTVTVGLGQWEVKLSDLLPPEV